MSGPNEISPAQLWKRFGAQTAPLVIDLRTGEDYALDPRRVPSAVRCEFTDLDRLQTLASTRETVIYCQKGRKISQGAAALLRARGFDARVLEGGQVAWIAVDLATVATLTDAPGPTRLVTRHRPKIDRIACPWLIRRFIDPLAEFLFVPPIDVDLVAEKFGATPFDVEGAALSHSGDQCSFDAFLGFYGLRSDALVAMAQVIRATYTGRLQDAPEAEGLTTICLGLSLLHKDDVAQLADGMIVFDGLYRWARDAQGETNDWPATAQQGGQGAR